MIHVLDEGKSSLRVEIRYPLWIFLYCIQLLVKVKIGYGMKLVLGFNALVMRCARVWLVD